MQHKLEVSVLRLIVSCKFSLETNDLLISTDQNCSLRVAISVDFE